MATAFQVTFDCADPAQLSEFWAKTLGYKLDDPPPGFDTWPDFLRAQNVPEDQWNKASAIVDPDGKGSRVFFQKVPEGKAAKNRVHLDVSVSGGRKVPEEERRQRINREVERVIGLGATRVKDFDEMGQFWVVMQDPEENEFCLV